MSARDGALLDMMLFRRRCGVAGTINSLGCGRTGLMDKGGDEADELQRDAGGVFELVQFIGGDIEDIAGFNGLFHVVAEDDAFAGEDEHFVFVIVLVLRRMAAGGDDEFSHGEGGAAVIGAAEKLHLHLLCAGHGDGLLFDGVEAFENHGCIKASGGRGDKEIQGAGVEVMKRWRTLRVSSDQVRAVCSVMCLRTEVRSWSRASLEREEWQR